MFKRHVLSIIFLFLSLVFYLLLSGSVYRTPNIFLFSSLLIPLFFIYFYFIVQVFHHEQDLPEFMWFFIFAVFYRFVFFFSDPLIPFDTFETMDFAPGINEVNTMSLSSPILPIFEYIMRILGGTIFAWRFILLFFEIVLLMVLVKLVRFFSMSPYRLVLVFLNPLWIIEIYRNGGLEIIGALLLWLAIYLFYMKKDWFALSLGIAAFLVHIVEPVLAILPLGYHKFRWKILVLSSGIILLMLLFSFIKSESIPAVFIPISGEVSNGVLYTIITFFAESLNVPLHSLPGLNWSERTLTLNTGARLYYNALVLLSILIVIITQIKKMKMTAPFRGANYLQSSFIVLAVFLILKPDLYPWHLILILPYLIFLPRWSWFALTFLIQIAYLVLVKNLYTTDHVLALWLLAAQYVPFFALLIFEHLDHRRIKGWF